MLLIVSVVLTIVLFICFSVCYDKDYNAIGLVCLFGGIVSGIIASLCVIFFIGNNIQYFRTSAKLKLEQQRAAIIYCLENCPESVVGLASDISEYNSTIMTGRLRQDNIWFSNITYDFYDELELIDIGGLPMNIGERKMNSSKSLKASPVTRIIRKARRYPNVMCNEDTY